MSTRSFALLFASMLSAATLGCRDGLSPSAVQGTYVLQLVGDDPVPVILFSDVRGTARLIADTLRLGTDGRGSFTRVSIIEVAAGPVPLPVRSDVAVTYQIAGSRIEIFFLCPPNASCTSGPHLIGRRYAGGMLVEEALMPEATRYYRRLPASPSGP